MPRHARAFAVIALTILCTGAAMPRAQQPADDTRVLTELLTQFLAGASRNDVAVHDRFWAEDLIYTSSAGRRMGKADILRDMRAAALQPPQPAVTYGAEDVRIQLYGDAAVVAFRLIRNSPRPSDAATFLNTGTFIKRNGTWKAVAGQATPASLGPR
jgi:hypothetical protein